MKKMNLTRLNMDIRPVSLVRKPKAPNCSENDLGHFFSLGSLARPLMGLNNPTDLKADIRPVRVLII